jgi:hypothetical protein
MGQQEKTVATEERGGGTQMKRIMALLTVVALIMVMVALSAAPAFAAWNPATGCRTGSFPIGPSTEYQFAVDQNQNGIVCEVIHGTRAHYYDDRPVA